MLGMAADGRGPAVASVSRAAGQGRLLFALVPHLAAHS